MIITCFKKKKGLLIANNPDTFILSSEDHMQLDRFKKFCKTKVEVIDWGFDTRGGNGKKREIIAKMKGLSNRTECIVTFRGQNLSASPKMGQRLSTDLNFSLKSVCNFLQPPGDLDVLGAIFLTKPAFNAFRGFSVYLYIVVIVYPLHGKD